jgi:hypothetical protein
MKIEIGKKSHGASSPGSTYPQDEVFEFEPANLADSGHPSGCNNAEVADTLQRINEQLSDEITHKITADQYLHLLWIINEMIKAQLVKL